MTEEGTDAALFRTGARDMRERAIEAALRAYPDADAMLRALHAIPIDPEPRSRTRIEIEETEGGGASIVFGEKRIPLRGGLCGRILSVAAHMKGHGRAWAETYLGGVADGLAHAAATRLEDVIAEIRGREGRLPGIRPPPEA